MPVFLLSLLVLFSVPAWAEEMPTHIESKSNLTILVDEQLLLPASTLARYYASHNGTPLTVVMKDGPMASNQIGQGLEAHVIITAQRELTTSLAAQGLTDVSSNRTVARTQLALVASSALNQQGLFARHISFAAILFATPNVPIYLDAPEYLDGARAAQLRNGFPFSDEINSRAMVLPNRTALLAAMAEKPGLAFMLAADAVRTPGVSIVSILPETISAAVNYESVVLASESMQDSRQFTRFLLSPAAQEILKHYGFQPASVDYNH